MKMTDTNHVRKIAIIGAGGHIGSAIAKALIDGGKHEITAITRHESAAIMPEGLHAIRKADYNDHGSLVRSMQGNEVLIITMATQAPKENQTRIVDAAKDAGISWVMPNEYGNDYTNERYAKDFLRTAGTFAVRQHIEQAGLKWIALNCGFWCVSFITK